jgi:hypothetical protein
MDQHRQPNARSCAWIDVVTTKTTLILSQVSWLLATLSQSDIMFIFA